MKREREEGKEQEKTEGMRMGKQGKEKKGRKGRGKETEKGKDKEEEKENEVRVGCASARFTALGHKKVCCTVAVWFSISYRNFRHRHAWELSGIMVFIQLH